MAIFACETSNSQNIFQPLPSHIIFTTSDPSQIPTNAFILAPLHETFELLLRNRSGTEAGAAMVHRFELSHSSSHPNIATEYLLHCGPSHGPFFNSNIWDTIVNGLFYAAPLSPNQYQGFSPIMTLLLNPAYAGNSKTHPLLPTG